MGVSHRLAEANVPLTSLKYILISHHHSDHNLEYGNLVYNAWVAGLSTPIQSFGPKGIEAMTKTYWELNKFDVETRIEDEGRPVARMRERPADVTSARLAAVRQARTSPVSVSTMVAPIACIMANAFSAKATVSSSPGMRSSGASSAWPSPTASWSGTP